MASVGEVSHAIFRVARVHKSLAGQLLRETGLYPGQELVMMRLWDEGPQRQVDLVRTLDSDAPTMARTLRRLERAGFVRRSPSPTDGRAVIIEATRASLPLRAAVTRIWAELEALTVGTMGRGQRDRALAVLAQLEANLTAAEERQASDTSTSQ
ncbi:MarR family winged helix-turn-helix transcriptional regulator [Nocardioides sp. cx-173]|uniref:MarR family winged helix-turn-helix transcriptional regulator n=1 Tax=Nocardioides sp. cx-173 TaxID=2898796 RepID=UPI001E3636DB|nr:MarR family transcriptional regulator [Nocardioides sp. cx-173]MCD4527445.1 MarR family transcriptional regulator [Nocardioides sp. cx-173]UGB40993.1 MarR family transcriptional regulator [Nocardioides sp. cx-173]